MRRTVGILVVLVSLLAAGDALAQAPVDLSGVDQYVEPLPPSGSGNQPTGPGAGNQTGGTVGGKPRRLPPSVAKDLRERGGSDAPVLKALATLPSLGAPGNDLRRSADARSGPSTGNNRSTRNDGTRGAGGRNGGGERGATADSSGAAEGLRDVSFGEAISSAVGAMADTDGGGGPSPLLLALLAISAALVATAVFRAKRNRA